MKTLRVLFLLLFAAPAAADPQRSYGLDLSANNSLGAAASNHARFRFNSSTGRLELSLATGAYDSLVTSLQTTNTLAKLTTAVSSVTTGEVDAQVYTMPANTMTVDGQKVTFDAAFSHAANTNSASWKFYVAGTAMFNQATSTSSQSESMQVTCVRRSSSVLRCHGVALNGNTLVGTSLGFTVDYTSPIVFKTAVLGAASNGDITSYFLRGEWLP